MTILYLYYIPLMIRPAFSTMSIHFKCRSRLYPRSNVERFPVPDEKVPWFVEYKDYKPSTYNSPSIEGKPWADNEIGNPAFKPKWNDVDGNVNRKSYVGLYEIKDGYPLNPVGRTGIVGRGVLGRWGPNHAADPVVTRWKQLNNKEPVLQFIAIKRRDTGEWALPGGMVDPGEKVAATAIREFQEEAMNSIEATEDEKAEWKAKFHRFFSAGVEIYSGYVDDPRNTDNAWMETVAYNFHDESGTIVAALELKAGDDAVGVRWVDITNDLNLYASHKDIVSAVLKRHTDK
ncbi:ADP-ribose pyrophosphatase, mitochondrial isoform X2 [Bicyclus anynana]|uniref:ADP-ribose pyrophosphatase, mitochondrial isoform X2 n=1 Tax=Bicyclus anynana TaxID=110368 RepID=A0A6J1NET0_BICAN|nr:ADP-ribose pyrophosphatase, mitochondrial isoform X2 [Bicyclus anynana]